MAMKPFLTYYLWTENWEKQHGSAEKVLSEESRDVNVFLQKYQENLGKLNTNKQDTNMIMVNWEGRKQQEG